MSRIAYMLFDLDRECTPPSKFGGFVNSNEQAQEVHSVSLSAAKTTTDSG